MPGSLVGKRVGGGVLLLVALLLAVQWGIPAFLAAPVCYTATFLMFAGLALMILGFRPYRPRRIGEGAMVFLWGVIFIIAALVGQPLVENITWGLNLAIVVLIAIASRLWHR